MANLLWQSYPDTGYCDIDVEHRAISRDVAKLQGAVLARNAGETTAALGLVHKAIAEHFAHEEQLMQESAYPEAAGHLAAHADILGRVRHVADEVAAKGLTDDLERWATEQLPELLYRHIMGHDAPFAAYLLGQEALRSAPP